MRTRNAETPKSGATKKTPVKKTTPKPSEPSTETATTTTPKTTTTTPKQPKSAGPSKTPVAKTTPNPEPKVEDAEKATITPTAKPAVKKTPPVKKTVKSPKAVAVKTTPKSTDKSLKKEVINVEEETSTKEESAATAEVEMKKEEQVVETKEEQVVVETKEEQVVTHMVEDSELEEDAEEKAVEGEGDVVNTEEVAKEDGEGEEGEPEEDEDNGDEGMEEDGGEQEGFVEPEGEEIAEDDAEGDEEEIAEETGGLEEHMEMSDLAKERRIKKEQEIFVGGLDRDSVEEDVKKAFEKIGEIVEVRLHRNPMTKKNKGYAFVKFASKELASKALNELKNPVIRGKRCGTAPSEDNDTLFVGNICNTWTKEAIKKKLKEYGIEGVENVNLVPDAQHEGLSRGFSFVEFSCHADAMLAYKRLQKPDVIFGHAERTVKVAFAEPLRDPDPEVMAQVKSVFVDGLPPHWDEERVREHFLPYGEIERIVLARNMSTAKRKDFGFVDYKTHEAAIACIDGVNNTDLGDEKSKTKVKVRLANPMPKTQAVKGGLCGGFRIGRAGSGFSKFGRGFGRGGRSFNRGNNQRARGRGRTGRFNFVSEESLEGPYSGSQGRRSFGGHGQRGYVAVSSRDAASSRPDVGRSRYVATERGRGRPIQSRRQPFSSERQFSRPLPGRDYIDDPYYDDIGYGIKRPYSMLDHEPDYVEPSRLRPRFDHPDTLASSRDPHYQGTGGYPRDYYGSTYGSSSYYGGERSYGGGYYY